MFGEREVGAGGGGDGVVLCDQVGGSAAAQAEGAEGVVCAGDGLVGVGDEWEGEGVLLGEAGGGVGGLGADADDGDAGEVWDRVAHRAGLLGADGREVGGVEVGEHGLGGGEGVECGGRCGGRGGGGDVAVGGDGEVGGG